MANEHGLFFDSVNGDRVYNSDSFAEWLRKFFTTGVFNGDLQVQPSSGMSVTVGTGYANIEGRVRFFDTTQTKTLPVANGTYPRIDTIVVRLDLGNRQITCETVQGTYSGNNPSPTAPVREDGIYEIVLAQIYVGAGVTEITAANITDTRSDNTLCGWITSTVEGVPMEQIVSQMQSDFNAWFDHMKDQLDTDAAGHLQQEIDDINDNIDSINDNIGDTDIGGGTITAGISALQDTATSQSASITSVSNSLQSFITADGEWEVFNGTVGGSTQAMYRKRLSMKNPFYMICGCGTVNRAIGAGSASQVSINWTGKNFKSVLGGACNLAFQGQTLPYMTHCSLGANGFDAYLMNNTGQTLSTVRYTFVAIGVYW